MVGSERERPPPLVALSYPGGTAGVVWEKEIGVHLLTSDVEWGGGTGLEGFEVATMETEVGTGLRAAWRSLRGRAEVLTVVGGLAPTEVVSAEVEEPDGRRRAASIGDGAWVIVLPGEAPFTMPAEAGR